MTSSSHTHTVTELTPESVRVVMPVPRVGCVIAFLGLWMIGWAAGEFSALRSLFFGGMGLNIATLFLLVWLVGWTAGGLVAGSIFLLMLDGSEIVTVGDGVVRRRVEVFGVGLSWRYPLERVSNWRPTGDESGVKSFITFDYDGPKGSKGIRFGTGLTEPRAEEICAEVWSRFPALQPRSRVDVGAS